MFAVKPQALNNFTSIPVSELLSPISGHSVCACSSLKDAGFPLRLLPQCVPSGYSAGQTCSDWHGIPAGTPVGAALGDFQCSVYSCMRARTDAGETGSLTHLSPDGITLNASIPQKEPITAVACSCFIMR